MKTRECSSMRVYSIPCHTNLSFLRINHVILSVTFAYLCVCVRYLCVCARYLCFCDRYLCVCARYLCVCARYPCACVRYMYICLRYLCVYVRYLCVILLIILRCQSYHWQVIICSIKNKHKMFHLKKLCGHFVILPSHAWNIDIYLATI